MRRDPRRATFQTVLDEESLEISVGRQLRYAPTNTEPPTSAVGIAFSGGGIRSATFNLGVLQALAGLGLLRIFDYMSTVSGGGYVGSWFSAWVHRAGLAAVEHKLKISGVGCSGPTASGANKRPREISFLSEYSNYLTPRLGLFSGDTWAFIGSYVR